MAVLCRLINLYRIVDFKNPKGIKFQILISSITSRRRINLCFIIFFIYSNNKTVKRIICYVPNLLRFLSLC